MASSFKVQPKGGAATDAEKLFNERLQPAGITFEERATQDKKPSCVHYYNIGKSHDDGIIEQIYA